MKIYPILKASPAPLYLQLQLISELSQLYNTIPTSQKKNLKL